MRECQAGMNEGLTYLGSLITAWSNPRTPGAFNFCSFKCTEALQLVLSTGTPFPQMSSPQSFPALELAAEPNPDNEAQR